MRREAQPVWHDAAAGFTRRSVSPPTQALAGEAVECRLAADTRIDYEASPRPGLEHHLVMLEGRLELTVEGVRHDLREGDCLRYLLTGPSSFHTQTGESARYLLFMV